MFIVSEAEAAAIRAAFERGGEPAAAVEVRRLFPGITDDALARSCARTIAGWTPPPADAARHRRGTRSGARTASTTRRGAGKATMDEPPPDKT
jgi:hypothetical protein